jgi:hypothetical protein
VDSLDLLDDTPLLDIELSIPAFDAFDAKRIGYCAVHFGAAVAGGGADGLLRDA